MRVAVSEVKLCSTTRLCAVNTGSALPIVGLYSELKANAAALAACHLERLRGRAVRGCQEPRRNG